MSQKELSRVNVGIPMQDYKFLHMIMVMILANEVDTQTHA